MVFAIQILPGRLRLYLVQTEILFLTFVQIFSKLLLKVPESPSISSPRIDSDSQCSLSPNF